MPIDHLPFMMTLQRIDRTTDWRSRRVTVMGLGRFGGGLGAARFFVERGARVTVTDSAAEAQLVESLAALDDLAVGGLSLEALHLGGHVEEDFTRADLVVASPAVPRDNRYLALARAAGVPVTSEMNLFWALNPAPVVAVTGSNGKSTTTALTHSILRASGRPCRLGGNIGKSLLPEVDDISADEIIVLELSSFQLEDLDALRASPCVAVVTNFSANHLDRHGTLDEYRRAKQTILRWQKPDDVAVLNADDADVSRWPVNGRRLDFGLTDRGEAGGSPSGAFLCGDEAIVRVGPREETIPLRRWLKLPGRHNIENALAATCAALAAGASLDDVRRGLETYEPLPHRLQLVAETAGRRFYNDSLATTPESTLVALEAFDAPIVLLAGGYDKQVDLTAMAEAVARRCHAIALMGRTATTLDEQIARTTRPAVARQVCASFGEAFAWAAAQTAPGDIVLLSPGCASYDWFRNFSDRGDQFTTLARAWRPDE